MPVVTRSSRLVLEKKEPDPQQSPVSLPARQNTFTLDEEEPDPQQSPVSLPARQNTFTLDEKVTEQDLQQTHVSLPARQNTFTLGEEETTKSSKRKTTPVLKRSSTFTVDDADDPEIHISLALQSTSHDITNAVGENTRRSIQFTASRASGQKTTPCQNSSKVSKSIGQRIMSSSIKHGSVKSAGKQQNQGSTLKKTIAKNNSTPGSVYKNKYGVAKKPDFKKIHARLFGNMESLSENRQRTLERAQSIMNSPVPRCAVAGRNLKTKLDKTDKNTVKSGTPNVSTPIRDSPKLLNSKIPVAAAITKPENSKRSALKPVNKEEAKTIVVTKKPQLKLEKKKTEERNIIQGVRSNKRFLLQMQMRENKKQK